MPRSTCADCNEVFSSLSTFDMHKVRIVPQTTHTPVGTPTHRCLTPDECRAKGMIQNPKGVWTSGEDFAVHLLRRIKSRAEEPFEDDTREDE